MKVVITLAGLSSQAGMNSFLGHKALIEVAGKYVIDHVVESISNLNPSEVIFVLGHKRNKLEKHIKEKYTDHNTRIVYQEILDGSGSAVRIALEDEIQEDELLVLFGDKIIDVDFKKVITNLRQHDAIVFSSDVLNPSRYDVLSIRESGDIYEVEDHPENPSSNTVMVGGYYFKSLQQVKKILADLNELEERVDGKYKFFQVIDRYIKMVNVSIKSYQVKTWFNCVRSEIILEANRYYLEKLCGKKTVTKGTSIIISPSYVSSEAIVENSVIGPYASVGSGARIYDSSIKNTVISKGADVKNLIIKDSLIGKRTELRGKPSSMNIGDDSKIILD